MTLDLTPAQLEINRLLERLDECAKQHECKWGVDRLQTLAGPQLRQKWDTQIAKLNAAITSSNLTDMRQLVEGTIRAWGILEQEAMQSGHTCHPPEVWEVQHPSSGRVYRICKTLLDAKAVTEEGYCVYTLEEIARLLETKQMVNVVKENFPGAVVTRVTPDWKKGDEIPF